MPRTLLIFTAHPDDESFLIGGTIARYAANGDRVILVCATRGEAGVSGLSAEETARIRKVELCNAARILGVHRLEFLGYMDGQLAQVPLEEAVRKVLNIVEQEQPQVVITFGPDGISGHPDHLAVYRWTKAAFERGRPPARLFYIRPSEASQQGCGVVSSGEIAEGPVATIDIGDFVVTKVRAMQAHASQEPTYLGDPEQEASKLTCHEYFTLARPITTKGEMSDLFNH